MDKTLARRPIGQLLDGRYRVESHLADGGMATIYLGTDTRLERTVALKIMRPEFANDEDFVRRFVSEARTVAQLSHPNVVTVYDQGADGRTLYLAMEYVPGRNLRQLLRERGRLSPREALDIMDGVLAGLAAAHEAGLAHRDVKPENVLLTDSHAVKVADFGLARLVAGVSHTKSGMIIGTAAYLAPEQVSRGAADARTDVYAAGVVLFELLTGVQPHTGENPLAVAYKHVNEIVPPPSSLAPGLPPALDTLVALATSRDPDLRPGDAAQFLQAITSVRRGLPVAGGAGTPPPGFPAHAAPHGMDAVGTQPGMPAAHSGDSFGGRAPGGTGFGVGADDDTPAAGLAIPPGSWRGEGMDEGATARLPAPRAGYPPAPAGRGADHRYGPDPYHAAPNKTLIVASGHGPAPGPPLRYYDAAPREPRLQRLLFSRRLGYLAVALAALLVIGGVGWWQLAGRYAAVPDLAGINGVAASTELRGMGFTVKDAVPQVSDRIAKGDVIRTVPGPGAKVLHGGQVTLVTSAGPKMIAVPQVTGQPLAAATAALHQAGLTAGKVTYQTSATIPAGIVLATRPAAGAPQAQPQPVGLVVSAGPPVPNFIGQDKSVAEQWAAANNVRLDEVVTTKGDAPLNSVVRQSAPPGSAFTAGQVIIITISQPQLVPIPNLQGMRAKDAVRVLRHLGFKVAFADSGLFKVVINYSPNGQAPKGSTITLYLG